MKRVASKKAVSKSHLWGATVGIITGQTANVKTDVVLSRLLLVAPWLAARSSCCRF